jgi:hypothetical protein
MVAAISDYFSTLCDRFGQGWNRFWFTPSDPLLLSLLRVLTGAFAFYVVFSYTPDLQRFFGPGGLLPVAAVEQLRGDYFGWSYLSYTTTAGGLWAAHIAGLIVLALFAFGLFARVTSVLSLVVVLSYIHRAPILVFQAESVLAFLMFYLCLGPSGAYLSLDRVLAARRAAALPAHVSAKPQSAKSWAATIVIRLIQIHLTVVYVMMLLAQLQGTVWWDGSAVWWLIGRPDSALVDFSGLYAHPWVVNAWTHSIVAFEAAFALLAWNRLAAPLLIVVGCVVWTLLALLTGMVAFAAAMMIANLAFLPESTLRRIVPSAFLFSHG